MDTISLFVGGKIYAGWTEASITTAIEQISGTFDLKVTELWAGQLDEWAIPCGEFCQIKIDDVVIISGFVDKVEVSFDAGNHSISISGRDLTGDLVDCSAPSKNYTGQTIVQILEDLAKPYGIKIINQIPDRKGDLTTQTKLQDMSVQNGDSVFETMNKAAKQLGVMLISDGNGSIIITSAGKAGNSSGIIAQGVNILSASFEQDASELFSEITVKGQTSGIEKAGIDGDVSGSNADPKKNAHAVATVKRAAISSNDFSHGL